MMLNQLAGKIQSSHGEISALSTKSKKKAHQLLRIVEIILYIHLKTEITNLY